MSNTNIQLATLDFSDIKSNFITFLQGQEVFKDYDFAGSALSVLLDVLAYDTTYKAFYLNMVGNEMFLDSATQRASVVSKAKLLNYVPKSAIAPTAIVNMNVSSVLTSTLTLPIYTLFLSAAINGVNYPFLTVKETTVPVTANTAVFNDIQIKQGTLSVLNFLVDTAVNPTLIFEVPDNNIDITTLQCLVQTSSSNTSYVIFTSAQSKLGLDGTSAVFFLQEGNKGRYQIYFGDGILGKTLVNGNIVQLSYLTTNGSAAAGANSFSLMSNLGGFGSTIIIPRVAATQGGDKESIDSIKFQAPKAYAAQGRAVTKSDYISIIQENTLGISFDAVNVWGGEENIPPIYGQVFISMKPTGAFDLTETQKQRIVKEVIKPISVMTVQPTVVDPDYTYIQLSINVLYDSEKTRSTESEIQASVLNAVKAFGNSTLNTFNSTFNAFGMLSAIQAANPSIITSEYQLTLQKKFFPNLTTPTTIKLYYNTPLNKGMFQTGVFSSPSMQFRNPSNLSEIFTGCFLEEVPASTDGVEEILISTPGFGYQLAPEIKILGDGTGAKAHATVSGVNGSLHSIVVDEPGFGYTSAIATVTPQAADTTGRLGSVIVYLQGRFGTLRTFYNVGGVKNIQNPNAGTIEYKTGIITLDSFNPVSVDNPLGQLAVSVNPTTSVVSSTFNGILTIDPFDPSAIIINVVPKS